MSRRRAGRLSSIAVIPAASSRRRLRSVSGLTAVAQPAVACCRGRQGFSECQVVAQCVVDEQQSGPGQPPHARAPTLSGTTTHGSSRLPASIAADARARPASTVRVCIQATTNSSQSSLPDEATAGYRTDPRCGSWGADTDPSEGWWRNAMPVVPVPEPQEPADIVAAYREAMRELAALRQERTVSARKVRAE